MYAERQCWAAALRHCSGLPPQSGQVRSNSPLSPADCRMAVVDRFILQGDTQLVVSSTAATTVRTGSLGVPLLPASPTRTAPQLSGDALLQLLLHTALPLWFLLGGLWSAVTAATTARLRSELQQLAFLFTPQSNSLQLAGAATDLLLTQLDQALALVFMGIKVRCRGHQNKNRAGICFSFSDCSLDMSPHPSLTW